jgi:hypothetical protein
MAEVRASPLPLPPPVDGKIAMGALWQLTSAEPRFGGLSALAFAGADLLAVNDSGVVIRWPKPEGLGRFQDLPDGPGAPQWKIYRDSEAMVRDPRGRGWWIAFEQFHRLYLFDDEFTRALARRPFKVRTWWRNLGVEALVSDGNGGLLLLPESGNRVIRLGSGAGGRHSSKAAGQVADAVRLRDGRIVIAVRNLRPWGITNSLGWLRREGDGYKVELWGELPLGRWDNVEGLASEPLADGSTRLWFVTDSDFTRRTLLGWLNVTKAPARTGA